MPSNQPRPFRIDIPQGDLDDLERRLAATRLPEKETVDDWEQGIPLDYVKDLAAYWASDYDWRKCEARLNAHPNFLIGIDGIDIHFIHVRSENPDARPLLLTHGWPGSVLEFLNVIEPLSRDYHLVIPSLPGYGFSGKPAKAGWGIERIAKAWNQLMLALGYARYFAQGGDWGSVVTSEIGSQNLRACAGIHINMVVGPLPEDLSDLTDFEKRALARMQWYRDNDAGYSTQQSTRPQTLGYALADSPVGQMAWIVEKFHNWTDCDGHPENVASREHLIDNVMLYWLTNSAASSARLYWESFGKFRGGTVPVPTGCSLFPKELFALSRRWAEKRYTQIVYWNEHEKGGHFAAVERPEEFVSDVRSCFNAMTL